MPLRQRRKMSSQAAVYSFLLLLLSHITLECSPGSGGFRRKSSRKMTPLVFKQHVPNISETTFGASGTPEGRINRDDPGFKDLVANFNPDIIFKDEEGTGADRIMTQRCKDKLNTLAIQVMNQWPGIKVRVTEGWDEEQRTHAKDSLHYEGRAVDITTSDRDRSKYGMLARLAVEAGFDWVYYESRGHVHCSVKSDTSIASNYGGCFPSLSLVHTEHRGTLPMEQLREGDSVLTVDDSGRTTYSEVILFFHKDGRTSGSFLSIETSSGNSVTLTANHLIHTSQAPLRHSDNTDIQVTATFAKNVKRGDYIYSVNNGVHAEQVVNVTSVTSRGMYAPLTKHGTIIVDGHLASCYAHIDSHTIAHLCLAPMRALHSWHKTFYSSQRSQQSNDGHTIVEYLTAQNANGVQWYADMLHSIALYVIPTSLMFTS